MAHFIKPLKVGFAASRFILPEKFTRRPDGTTGSIPHDIIISLPYDILGDIVDNVVFVSDDNYEITRIVCIPRVVGSHGSAVTADVVKVSGTTAPASGVTVMTVADSFDLKATVETLQVGLLAAGALKQLTINDRLALNFTGTMTAAVGFIQINLKRLQSAGGER